MCQPLGNLITNELQLIMQLQTRNGNKHLSACRNTVQFYRSPSQLRHVCKSWPAMQGSMPDGF